MPIHDQPDLARLADRLGRDRRQPAPARQGADQVDPEQPPAEADMDWDRCRPETD